MIETIKDICCLEKSMYKQQKKIQKIDGINRCQLQDVFKMFW